jgi:hypothetical protein
MAIQYVNIGQNPNDGTGDDLRSAFLKVNDNFQLLATIGGETNLGLNVGGGSGQVFARKTNETLEFRTIAAGTGIGVSQAGNVITIANTFTAPNSFNKIFIGDANNTYYTAAGPNDSFRLRSEGAIQLGLLGNTVTITGVFSLTDDPLPTLSANLNLNSYNITGNGNINIVGSSTVDSLTVGRSGGPGNYPGVALINGTLTVQSDADFQSIEAVNIVATNSISGPNITASTGFTGNLTGNTTGTHYGNVAIKGVGLNPDVVVINTALSPATLTGNLFGNVSGGFTGDIISGGVNLNSQTISGSGRISVDGIDGSFNNPLVVNSIFGQSIPTFDAVPTINDGSAAVLFTMSQQDGSSDAISESLRLRSVSVNSNQTLPLGTGITFESQNIIDTNLPSYDPLNPPTQPEYIRHGYVGVLNYKEFGISTDPLSLDDSYSSFVVKVRNKTDGQLIPSVLDDLGWFREVIIARGDGRVTVSLLDLDTAKIKPTRVLDGNSNVVDLDFDLILQNNRAGRYINFYGDYEDLTPDQNTGDRIGNAIGGYSFPKQIGSPGQMLSPVIGTNLLSWIDPPAGTGGGGASAFLNLTDTPSTYLPTDAGRIVRVKSTFDGLEFTNSISATVTGTLIGNASTATALLNARQINGKTFDGTQNVTLTTIDVAEDTNLYFTEERVRDSISVNSNIALTYDALTGEFDLAESVSNTANTLVKRDENGIANFATIKVSNIEKNVADTAITFNSPISTDEEFTSTASISTTGSLSAGFITLTGTGNQTLTSTDKIILNPTTTVDVSGKKIINLPLAAPTSDTDASNKKYVDDSSNSVLTASLQTLPISGDTGGVLTVLKNETLNITGSTNISTSTTGSGIQVNLKSTISGVTVSGNLPVTGQVFGNSLRGGNVVVSSNAVSQSVSGSDLNLVPGANGGSVVVSGGDLKLINTRLSITGSDIAEFPANTLEQQLSLTTAITFIRTLNWVDTNANFAFAELPNGQLGQIKTIIMRDRGTFGDALDTRPRYLILRGNINGSSRTVNIAQNDPNGSSTFIFLDNFWWRISHVA